LNKKIGLQSSHGKKMIIMTLLIALVVFAASCNGMPENPEVPAVSEAPSLPKVNPNILSPNSSRTISDTGKIISTPTTFQFTDFIVEPAKVDPGEKFLVLAHLANTGNSAGSYAMKLEVNGSVKFTKEVHLAAGETAELQMSGHEYNPGVYELSVGSLKQQLVVREPSDTLILSSSEPPNPPETVPKSSTCCDDNSTYQGGCGCAGSASISTSPGGCGCSG